MAAILSNLRNTVIASFVLAAVLLVIFAYLLNDPMLVESVGFWAFIFRWIHVFSGVMWIGMLWYFNFVQMPTMPKIPDDKKAAVSGFIAPEALYWFRWGAMSTIVSGLILAHLNGYLVDALTLGASNDFGNPKDTAIGIGMWLGIIMWFNVWFIIWPGQQKALNIKNAYPDLPADQKAKAARTVMLFSRTNTLLSFPMLLSMVAAQNIF